MESPGSKTVEFRCGLGGVISKQAPDLLKDGQYRSLLNVVSNQEGSISSRTGIKKLGHLTTSEPTCYFIRKLVVQATESPLTPATNPRYLGVLTTAPARDIQRTLDYASATTVASAVDADATRHWEMADYAAGESGSAWAYFACPNKMLKDRGSSPYSSPLPTWGVRAGIGVALVRPKTSSVGVSSVANSLDTWAGVVVTMASPVALSDYDRVAISGETGGLILTTTDSRTSLNTGTWAIRIGVPDGSGGTLFPDTEFRIFDDNGQAVQATGTITGTVVIASAPTAGNLDGGSESSLNNTQPYDWVFAYEESDTGDIGNPSQPMTSSGTATYTGGYTVNPLSIHNGVAELVVWGTTDTRIGFIRVYRRGGILYDTWRQVARITNPGTQTAVTVTDNMADADLVYQNQIETDNDPPVTSTVATPITASFSGSVTASTAAVTTASVTGTPLGKLTAGSLVNVDDGVATETVRVDSVVSTSSFKAFFQFSHASGVNIEIDAISGQPCHLAVTIDESVLVAGDPNNPHILYKSKKGKPQAFPVGTDAAGAITSIGVGSPSDRIVNITECRGQALCLNTSSLRVVAVLNGSLTQPYKAANKGLKGQSAWCKTPAGEVWFLSDDGIYSWDGGFLRKRTEAIDPLFHSQSFNGMDPLDMTPTALTDARMECRRGLVRLLYTNTLGFVREIVCDPAFNDRWVPIREDYLEGIIPEFANTMLFCEPDTQSLIVAYKSATTGATFGISDAAVPTFGVNYTSDWWITNPYDGTSVPWQVTLPWFDMGMPANKKLFEEVWLDIDPQLYAAGTYTGASSITIDLYLDYNDVAVDTFTVEIPSGTTSLKGRTLLSLLPNLVATDTDTYDSYGREARVISFKISGYACPVQPTIYRLIFQYQDTGQISAGSASDWMDMGSRHDKRLYQMAVMFETEGTDREIMLETRGGRDGKTAGTPQAFTLSSPTDLGSGRALKVFPLADPTIAKLMRVRPHATTTIDTGDTVAAAASSMFRILDVAFPDAEEYPPDIVSRAGSVQNGKVTEAWTTGGYDYDKYANQITFEVNTNNVSITVQLQADGANIGNPLVIKSTETDRKRNVTLPAGLKGKAWSVFVDPSQDAIAHAAGMWQLFNLSWKFQPADKGEVGHTFDWDDCDHPWDKYLKNITVEWDDTGGADVTLQLDMLIGIDGGTLVSDFLSAAPIVLSGGRGKRVFPLPADTIAKMIRIYPKGTTIPTGFKQWKYFVDKIPYPADKIYSTEWQDASSPENKNPSWLWVDMDTGTFPALVALQNENGSIIVVSHTGTTRDRKRNYAIPVDVTAKMWRLLLTPAADGKTQLFGWGFSRWRPWDLAGPDDPPETVLWTPWNDFGYPFPKMARDLILTLNTGGLPVTVSLETNEAGIVASFQVTTTYLTKRVVLSCPANLQGTLWRLRFTLGAGTIAQLWDWTLDVVKMPPALTTWSSYGQGFGYRGWKFCVQYWMDYICASQIQVTFISDTGSVTITLPAHPIRAVERYLFADIWGAGYNKSKLYGITIVTTNQNSPFQVFADMSGIEWMPIGADRHTGLQQIPLSEFMGVQV